MLTTIHITVRDRVPTITAGEDVISYNSDYVAEFLFDEEWQDKVKTVYFVCEDGSYQAVVMSGNSCGVPMLDGEHRRIFVGVQAGAAEKPSILKTTRPCCLKVKDSIADYLGQPIPDPTPDVYEQIIAMLNNLTAPTWDSVQDKPFSKLGSGLSVDENGVLSAEGGGGGSANAVQYVAQTLTDEQKKQARANIGASPIPTVRYWLNLEADNIINLYNMGVGYGIISPVDNDQTVPTGMSSPMLVIFGRMHYGSVDITVYDGAGAVWRGSLNLSSQTTDVTKTGDYVTNTALTDILQDYVQADEWYGILPQIEQAIDTKLDKNQGTANAGKILGIGADGIVVPQDKPSGSTVTVDDELSSTSENPAQNKVVTAALAGKITAPTTAAVGQIIKVKSVDTSGKPTEWEAVDMPSGGGESGVENRTYDFSVLASGTIPANTITSTSVGDGLIYTGVTLGMLRQYKVFTLLYRCDSGDQYYSFLILNSDSDPNTGAKLCYSTNNGFNSTVFWLDDAKTSMLSFAGIGNSTVKSPAEAADMGKNLAYGLNAIKANAASVNSYGDLSNYRDDAKIYVGVAHMNGKTTNSKDLTWAICGVIK